MLEGGPVLRRRALPEVIHICPDQTGIMMGSRRTEQLGDPPLLQRIGLHAMRALCFPRLALDVSHPCLPVAFTVSAVLAQFFPMALFGMDEKLGCDCRKPIAQLLPFRISPGSVPLPVPNRLEDRQRQRRKPTYALPLPTAWA